MAIPINREQRDSMHQEVTVDLNGLTDLWTELDLAWIVSHLIAQTGAIIHTHIVEPIERTPQAAKTVKAQGAFATILGQLAQGKAADEEPRDLWQATRAAPRVSEGLRGWRSPTPTCRQASRYRG
jgi:hypothetical protein